MLLSEITTGTYVAVIPTPSTKALLQAWAAEQRIELDQDLHVTILFSRAALNVVPKTNEFVATGVAFDRFGDALVLKLKCDAMEQRHEELIAQGGTHDYPDYVPHLTIQFKSELKVTDVTVPDFGLVFWREYVEPLKV